MLFRSIDDVRVILVLEFDPELRLQFGVGVFEGVVPSLEIPSDQVDDDVRVLKSLCLKLIDHRVMPYYLHQLDRVRGAAHFEVPVKRGRELIAELRNRLPGYAVPQYVQDSGGPAKKILA